MVQFPSLGVRPRWIFRPLSFADFFELMIDSQAFEGDECRLDGKDDGTPAT